MAHIVVGRATHQMFAQSLEPMVRAIGSSLGPNGRTVLCGRANGVARASSGVAIAREISSGGPRTGVAQKVLTETLVAADRDLGDGTARLALIAVESFRAAARCVATGLSAVRLADALDRRRLELSDIIADEGSSEAEMEHVAATAGVGPDFANSLASVLRDIGPSGGIEIVAGRNEGIRVTSSSGFVFDSTLVCSALPPGETLSLQDVHIIAADDIILDFGALAPVIEGFANKKKSLVIAAREIGGPARAALEQNRRAGILSVVALTPRDAGPQAAHLLEDLALATGAALVAERNGLPLAALKPAMLGRAGSLRLSEHRLELRNPGGQAADVGARIKLLEEEIRKNRYLSLDRERAERRRARLLGRWAEIRVGGADEFETENLIETGRRAVACMRSALGSGVVAGGGQTLSRVADRLEAGGGDGVTAAAAEIAAEGLRSIRRQLWRNAMGEPAFVDGRGDVNGPSGPISNTVVDPLRLTQAIVEQALSITASLLRVDAAVIR